MVEHVTVDDVVGVQFPRDRQNSQVEKSRSWLVVVRLRKDVLVVKVN